jgi:hypothetical protein
MGGNAAGVMGGISGAVSAASAAANGAGSNGGWGGLFGGYGGDYMDMLRMLGYTGWNPVGDWTRATGATPTYQTVQNALFQKLLNQSRPPAAAVPAVPSQAPAYGIQPACRNQHIFRRPVFSMDFSGEADQTRS